MVGRWPQWGAVVGLVGCTSGLPAEGEAARAALAAALADRSTVPVAQVSEAARAAAPWKGQDAELDMLLGDALANVLMRPAEGLALLRSRALPGDPRWKNAMGGAALRSATAGAVYAVQQEAGLAAVDAEAPGVAWLGARALRDPALGWSALVRLDRDCALLDGQPQRGRQGIDVEVPQELLAEARAQGASHVVLGRAERPTDEAPETGRGRPPCRTGRLLGETLPEPMERHLVVAMQGTGPLFSEPLYLSLGRGPSREPWVIGSTRSEAARSLIEAALAREPSAPEPAGAP